MNFIVVEKLGQAYQITVTKGLWMFGATAIPLTLFTISLWYLWDRRKYRESALVCARSGI
jgi:hypothetical protein